MLSKRKVIINLLIFLIIVLTLGYIFWDSVSLIFTSSESIREFIQGFGAFGPIVFIILTALQIFLAPVPGQIAGITGGYLFGAFYGTIYSMIGLILGSWLVFYLSRKFGRPFVERFVEKKHLERFDKIVVDKGVFVIFLIFLIPGLPDDAICYLAGLTKIKIRTLVLLSAIGRFPGFLALSLVGAGIATENNSLLWILSIIIAVISLVTYLFRHKIERFLRSL